LKNNGVLRAKYKLLELFNAGESNNMISLDITNAFNSVPRELIERCLVINGIDKND
jgi:hypothetical protein